MRRYGRRGRTMRRIMCERRAHGQAQTVAAASSKTHTTTAWFRKRHGLPGGWDTEGAGVSGRQWACLWACDVSPSSSVYSSAVNDVGCVLGWQKIAGGRTAAAASSAASQSQPRSSGLRSVHHHRIAHPRPPKWPTTTTPTTPRTPSVGPSRPPWSRPVPVPSCPPSRTPCRSRTTAPWASSLAPAAPLPSSVRPRFLSSN